MDRLLFISVAAVETIVVTVGVVIAIEHICLKILWLKNHHFNLLAFMTWEFGTGR